jgi:CMP-N,N'-diacetyllegionaminic acid synthase
MRILAIIPARGGSKGVPGKNIKLLGGKPLIAYTIEVAIKIGFQNIIVSTESKDIADIAKKYQAEVPFLRDISLAKDDTPSINVVLDLIEKLESNIEFEAICLLQPTVPFRDINFVKQAIEKFNKGGFDTLLSVKKVPDHYNPHWVFLEKNGSLKLSTGEESIVSRRQDLPPAYVRDGSIYLCTKRVLKELKSFYGPNIGFIENQCNNHVNIDTIEDWEKAEELAKHIDFSEILDAF